MQQKKRKWLMTLLTVILMMTGVLIYIGSTKQGNAAHGNHSAVNEDMASGMEVHFIDVGQGHDLRNTEGWLGV